MYNLLYGAECPRVTFFRGPDTNTYVGVRRPIARRTSRDYSARFARDMKWAGDDGSSGRANSRFMSIPLILSTE